MCRRPNIGILSLPLSLSRSSLLSLSTTTGVGKVHTNRLGLCCLSRRHICSHARYLCPPQVTLTHSLTHSLTRVMASIAFVPGLWCGIIHQRRCRTDRLLLQVLLCFRLLPRGCLLTVCGCFSGCRFTPSQFLTYDLTAFSSSTVSQGPVTHSFVIDCVLFLLFLVCSRHDGGEGGGCQSQSRPCLARVSCNPHTRTLLWCPRLFVWTTGRYYWNLCSRAQTPSSQVCSDATNRHSPSRQPLTSVVIVQQCAAVSGSAFVCQ